MHADMQTRSSLRRMVDEKLAAEGLTLSAFIADRRSDGQTVDEALTSLQETTGVPVALRTLWSWLKTDEYATANPAKEASHDPDPPPSPPPYETTDRNLARRPRL